jgi:hypothetical protein
MFKAKASRIQLKSVELHEFLEILRLESETDAQLQVSLLSKAH